MDKYEMKLRAEEIRSLVANKEFTEAMLLADTIDWSKVKNITMLTMVSDIYKMNKRYELSRDILLLAYERCPGGRKIVYSLCELSIKMDDFVQAVEYYKEFVQLAPKDTSKYILQYKIYEAQNVSIEERIQVLEEFKRHERREKWCYELAFLYHRIGLATKCVEECDEIVLWFGTGKYVVKALELKMLHEPLTPAQQEKYQNRNRVLQEMEEPVKKEVLKSNVVSATKMNTPVHDVDFKVQTFDADSKFNTIDIQKELAQSMQNIMTVEADTTPVTNAETDQTEDDQQPTFDTIEREVISEFMDEPKTQAQPDKDMQELVFEEEADPSEDVKEEAEEDDIEQRVLEEEPIRETSIVTNAEEDILKEEVPPEYADKLSQEYDGQISLVVPDGEIIEKQITGQLNIEDILTEWNRIKKELELKRAEEVRQRVKKQTEDVLYQFDVASRPSTLAELEAVADAQIAKEQHETHDTETSEELTDIPKSVEESVIGQQELMEDIDSDTIEELSILKGLADTTELPPVEELAEEPPEIEEPESETETAEPEEETTEEIEAESEEEATEEIEADTETEAEENPVKEEPEEETEEPSSQEKHIRNNAYTRELTPDEQEIFGEAFNSDNMKTQIATALDNISLASYTGNLVITGEAEAGTIQIAKSMIKSVQQNDPNFSGKVAKISGASLNTKDIALTFDKLQNGAIIIQKAGQLEDETLDQMVRCLDQENRGIIVVLEDTNKEIRKLLKRNDRFAECFSARVEMARMDNRILVKYGQKYAYEKEYTIDELGVLALHTRIADLQTGQHTVSLAEVREIIDEAIQSANRKNVKHFFDIIAHKRYDDEDMIVLREKDFNY